MLVLSRKVGEKVLIDGGIEITVLAIEGKRIRIGIEAPQDRRISRGETLEAPGGLVTCRTRDDARSRGALAECTV